MKLKKKNVWSGQRDFFLKKRNNFFTSSYFFSLLLQRDIQWKAVWLSLSCVCVCVCVMTASRSLPVSCYETLLPTSFPYITCYSVTLRLKCVWFIAIWTETRHFYRSQVFCSLTCLSWQRPFYNSLPLCLVIMWKTEFWVWEDGVNHVSVTSLRLMLLV